MLEFDLLQCKGHVNEFYPAKDQVINGALRDTWLEAPLAPGGQTLRERWKVLFASGA